MGTKVHRKNFLPGYYSMRDLNEDSSSSSWPQFNGDETITNGQYIDGFIPRTKGNGYPAYDKDGLKDKMREHETVFRNQVYELHRVYQLQRDIMEETQKNKLHKRASMEASSSSSLQGFQMPSGRHTSNFPLSCSGYARTPMLGVEISNSLTSCVKRNDTQPRQFLFQNQVSSKVCESLDSRPLKVRKKLFDLQLPAEVYVDCEDGEDLQDYKVPDVSRSNHGNGKSAPENRIMSTVGSSGVSASSARLRDSVWLADLNEPVYVEESSSPLPVEFHGHISVNGEANGVKQPRKSGVLGVNSSPCSRVNKREPISHIYEAGSSNNVGSLGRDLPKDNLPLPHHPFQGMLNPLHRSPGMYPTCNRKDLSRNKSLCVDFSDRIHPYHFPHLEPLVASQNSNPLFNSPSFTGSLSSWTKPKTSFTDPITPPEPRFLLSSQNQDPFTGKWQVDASFRLNSCFRGGKGEQSNGFCHGFSSGSKKLQANSPSAGFGFVNCSRGDAAVSDKQGSRGFGTSEPSFCYKDAKPMRDIDLNEVVSSSSDDQALLQDLNEPFMSVSTDGEMSRKYESSEAQNAQKLSGISAPEAMDCKEELAPLAYRCFIDLNSCASDSEDPIVSSIESKSNSGKVTVDIDLEEAPVSLESEEDFMPSHENKVEAVLDDVLTSAADTMVVISSSCRKNHFLDTDAALSDSLLWFVHAVTSCAAVRELPLQDFAESGDEFEEMTLHLAETEEENYMPRPFVSAEDGAAASMQVTRARRGQSRSGRQRRDFQRDILSGLISLSRHEVNEDLQTFGGLMKATGQGWNAGLTRRNGGRNRGGRGRPRAVVESGSVPATVCVPLIRKLDKTEAALEDVSLAGWGKTTRRPRRQRCPAGNPPAVILT